jgi:hypothetical protein|tara:strand:- start:591 stop:836 length:246 start_codon:yes stop_codon:yes gene_type:complete
MGWWSITDKSGGISSIGNMGLYGGDSVADIIDAAIAEVIKEYEYTWDRKPYIEEIEAALNFSTSIVFDGLKNAPKMGGNFG